MRAGVVSVGVVARRASVVGEIPPKSNRFVASPMVGVVVTIGTGAGRIGANALAGILSVIVGIVMTIFIGGGITGATGTMGATTGTGVSAAKRALRDIPPVKRPEAVRVG